MDSASPEQSLSHMVCWSSPSSYSLPPVDGQTQPNWMIRYKYLHRTSFCKEANVRKPQKATILKTCPFFLKRNRSLQVIKKTIFSKTHLLNCNLSTKVNLSFGAYIGVAFVQIVPVPSALSYVSHVQVTISQDGILLKNLQASSILPHLHPCQPSYSQQRHLNPIQLR